MVSILSLFLLSAAPAQDIDSLKQQRNYEQRLADQAARDADRAYSQDWLSYRKAMLRKKYLDARVQELDEEIEKRQKEP